MGEDMAARTSHDIMEMPITSLDCEEALAVDVEEADVLLLFFFLDLTMFVLSDCLDGIVKPGTRMLISSTGFSSLLILRCLKYALLSYEQIHK